MRFTIAASALFAGLVAANPITLTVESTQVDTSTFLPIFDFTIESKD